MSFKIFMIAALALAPALAQAVPAEVLIIRHGEKPGSSSNGDVDEDEGRDLSPKGYQRANALPALFTKDSRMLEFGTPVAIFAGSPKHADGSIRPLETIQPTATALGLQVNTSYLSKKFADMVADVMANQAYDNKTVLISWPHDQIVEMASEFGVDHHDLPKKWDGSVFDRVWRIEFSSNGDVVSFDDLPQRVLPGDSQN